MNRRRSDVLPDEERARLEGLIREEREARRHAESLADTRLQDLYAKQQQIELLNTIAFAANQSDSIAEVLRTALNAIGEFLDWPVGHAYLARKSSDGELELGPTGIWHLRTLDPVEAFRECTEDTIFRSGQGLPGRVLEQRAPVWIEHLDQDPHFPRRAAAALSGLRSGFAFPVMVGHEAACVLEFFAAETTPEQPEVLALLAQAGVQLGRVVERNRHAERLIHHASHDPLTGLPNRRLFHDRLEHAIARYAREPESLFAVLFVDLDRFKLVNDSLGHTAGDELLAQVGQRLLTTLRQNDTVSRPGVDHNARPDDTLARLGGDEFTILLEGLHEPVDALRVAERLQAVLHEPFAVAGQTVYVTVSIGIATRPYGQACPVASPDQDGPSCAEDLMREADMAMYRAKSLGKARCEFCDPGMQTQALESLRLETSLRESVERNAFVVHYQPIMSLADNRITGFEALVRWEREGELLPPDRFIPIAEDAGLVHLIDMQVLYTACCQLQAWNAQRSGPPLTISTNLSARQLTRPELVDEVATILCGTDTPPEQLRLEITETATLGNLEELIATLKGLKALGVSLAMDDFGTGYSSLSYLHRLPLDILKIDRAFVAGLDRDEYSQRLVQTVINMARNLGLEAVAEGVESNTHAATLRALGCTRAQGYYYSRPVPADRAGDLLVADQLPLVTT
ncbi:MULTISPECIES: bifunctional diguanylate cyclase/phosphodiesterase [unclassified Thioalkalivibrio]|uniref:putative bifunctional diguanylate cyclase/phosphodiesterase n=1 Tax=unclassified Thioalkalivibrio TaxID=2621013 RepID=UPI00036D7B29|nr:MULTISPECIES: EAL domain-containing protein [unclassified Thioalkalivibrio]